MAVRLSSGAHRHRRQSEMRPTAARTLEAVFNMLMNEIEGRRVLDLFSGVGSYGVLALRRGAESAVFVDNTREAAKRTTKAIGQYHLEDRAVMVTEDVKHFLHASERWEEPFDLIFADPPYEEIMPGVVAEMILESGLLSKDGVLIIEHSKRYAPPEIEGLTLRKSRVFGDTTVSIFDRKG
jgi:16S rRNA (guanine(966)-N(2))-methyltransferase RsmD